MSSIRYKVRNITKSLELIQCCGRVGELEVFDEITGLSRFTGEPISFIGGIGAGLVGSFTCTKNKLAVLMLLSP